MSRDRRRGIISLILAGALLASSVRARAASPVVGTADWPRFGNTANQQRYSSLGQINPRTVGGLGVAWAMPEGPLVNLWEAEPVVIDGVMYVTTSTDQVFALHADSGKIIWRYTPDVNFIQFALGGDVAPVNRGVAVAGGSVFLASFDDQLIAIDDRTGRVRWTTRVADPRQGYTELSPPVYWQGLLFIGSAGGDSGARGFVAAYDARTGRQIWRFYTVPRRGRGWLPAAGAHGGGDVWMPVTVDARRGLVLFGTGNPSPDLLGRVRPGCNRWTDAVVALHARTGAFAWGRTLVCPDTWDYDVDQAPMLLAVTRYGRSVAAVGEASKNGYYWLLDADTGEVLARSPALTRQSSPRPGPTATGALVCPGKLGGLEYSPPAFSPDTGAVYLPGIDMCMVYRSAASQANAHQAGQVDLGGEIVPTGAKPRGFMAALRADTLGVLWRAPMPAPLIGGALATGGLVFSGSDDGRFYAFDARSGAIRWSARIGLGFGAAPITYAVGGAQYIAISAGGSGVAAYTGAHIGGKLVVFKLGGKVLPR